MAGNWKAGRPGMREKGLRVASSRGPGEQTTAEATKETLSPAPSPPYPQARRWPRHLQGSSPEVSGFSPGDHLLQACGGASEDAELE